MAEKKESQIIPHQPETRTPPTRNEIQSAENINTAKRENQTKECDDDETEKDRLKDDFGAICEQHWRHCRSKCTRIQSINETPANPQTELNAVHYPLQEAMFGGNNDMSQKRNADALVVPNYQANKATWLNPNITRSPETSEENIAIKSSNMSCAENTAVISSGINEHTDHLELLNCEVSELSEQRIHSKYVSKMSGNGANELDDALESRKRPYHGSFECKESEEESSSMSSSHIYQEESQIDSSTREIGIQCNFTDLCTADGSLPNKREDLEYINNAYLITEHDLLQPNDGYRLPVGVSSDTMLCCGYKNINRSGRLYHNTSILTTSNEKRIRKKVRFDNIDVPVNETETQENYKSKKRRTKPTSEQDVLDRLFENMCESTSKDVDEGSDASDSSESSCADTKDGKDFHSFQHFLNNCATFSSFLRGFPFNTSNLNTTNSCDPSNSDSDEPQVNNSQRSSGKRNLAGFDNLSSNPNGVGYMKEFLSSPNLTGKYALTNQSSGDKHRSGMLLNCVNKKIDVGKDSGINVANNKIIEEQDQVNGTGGSNKVQASQFIGEYLYELWKNECLCDVSIKVGSQSYLAHKIVLAAFSDVFCPSEPMPTPTLMVDVPNSSPNAVFEILQYLYTSEMKITDDSLEDILNAALFLGVTDVVELIKDILSHPTKENVVHYLGVADRMQMPVNINDTPQLFREYLHEIWDSEIFKHITEEEMRKLLSDQMIMVDSETDLIVALSKWAEGDLDKRVKVVPKLLKYINFVRIEPDDLAKTTDNYPHIFNNTECQAILAEVYKSFAIIETTALKENSGSDNPRSSADETWRGQDNRSGKGNTGDYRPAAEHNTGKSLLNADTDATRRSINNQFRRASRRISTSTTKGQQSPQQLPESYPEYRQDVRVSGGSNNRRIQFDEAEGMNNYNPSSTFTRKDTAMPKSAANGDPSLHRRSLGVHSHDSGGVGRGPVSNGQRDYYNPDSDNPHASYETPPSGGNMNELVRQSTGRYGDYSSAKEVGARDPMMRDSPCSGRSSSEERRYNRDRGKGMGETKSKTGVKETCSGVRQTGYGTDYPREASKVRGTNQTTPSEMDCCYMSQYLKCPSIRVSCCNMDAPTPCPPATQANSCNSMVDDKASVQGYSKSRQALRDQSRASIRDTARSSRRATTRSPARQSSTRSPPYRRSTTPPPIKSVTPPARRSVTPPAGSRLSKISPSREMSRTPSRRSMRVSIRDQASNNDTRGNRPSMMEHNYSPTVINDSCRPSVTRKVLQNYKQDNPQTYNNVSLPNNHCPRPSSPSGFPRQSRADIPLVIGGKDGC